MIDANLKTLERQFFKYVTRQIKYLDLEEENKHKLKFIHDKFMCEIVEEFAIKKQCSSKQLYYYLSKWKFYIKDNGIRNGYIDFNKLVKSPYSKLIPARVTRHLLCNCRVKVRI